MSLAEHAPPAQLWRFGPAHPAKTALYPEPAALRPRPHRRGKTEQDPTRIRHHVTYTHTLIKAPYSSGPVVDVSARPFGGLRGRVTPTSVSHA